VPHLSRIRRLGGGLLLAAFAVLATAVIALGDAAPACTITGGPGNNTLRGTAATDVICGEDGRDTLIGLGGDDVLRGGPGHDVLNGGAGADDFEGGTGTDVARYADVPTPVTASIGDGANDGRDGGAEGDDILADVERIAGGKGDDDLTGDGGPNTLTGNAGHDDLHGGGGNDLLDGGLGGDTFAGGAGGDRALYESLAVPVTASIGDGANDGRDGGAEGDDVQADVEGIRGGSGSDVLAGNGGPNALDGRGGDDELDGGGGNDVLTGGGAADDFTGGTGVDTVSYGGNAQGVEASIGNGLADDGTTLDGDEIHGDVESISGGRGSDRLEGDGDANELRGNGGDDELLGGDGNDDLRGGDGDDSIEAGDDADQLFGEAGDDILSADGDGAALDELNCGPDADRALADPADTLDASCESQAPTANDDTLTVPEDDHNDPDGAIVDVLANDSDPEGRTLTVASVDTTGTVGLVTHSGTVNYRTNGEFRHLNEGMTASDSFTYKANDGTADSPPATVSITITGVNDAPVVSTSAGSTPYTEDDPATTIDGAVTISDRDDTSLEGGQVRISSGFQSGDELVFVNTPQITGNYNNGTGVLTLTGTATVADYQTALRSLRYRATQQTPATSKTVELKVDDGDTDSNLATKEIAVTPTNDTPIVDASNSALAYTEDDPATGLDNGLTIDDVENDNLSGASASITANYQSPQDALSWADNNLADNITLDNINTTAQTVVLTGLDTEASYQAALRAIKYANSSDAPSTSARTVTFSATDQPGLTGSDTRTINVTAVDDPPTAVDDSATVLEDAASTSIPVLTNDTDADGGPKTISSATDPANGTVVLTGGSAGAHTGLTYQPDPNYCNDPPGTTPDTLTYTVNGGSNATIFMTVTCVNDAPVADDETFNGNDSAHGNTTLQVDDPSDDKSAPANPHTEITGDILAGDTDIDNSGLSVTPGTFATNDGASVTLESDGDFVFQPAATTSCTDTSDFFDYTVEDNGSPEQTDTGRVTLAIAGCVWYVNNNATGNSGTSNAPYDTLLQAEIASGANHTVFVFDGDNTATGYDAGGYQLNSGERLIGEHEGLTVDPDQGGALSADSLRTANAGAFPTLTAAGGVDVIDLDDGNEIRGVNIDAQTGGGGVFGGAGDTGGGTFDDVNIAERVGTNGSQPGLELNGTTGTFNITNFTVDNDATGVLLNNAGTVDFGGDSGVVTLDSNGAPALNAASTNLGTSHIDDIIVTGSTTGGVNLSSASGTTALGDGSGTDLNLTTTGGATPALSIANSGTVTVGSGGTDELHATGGPAIDVTGTSGATFDFEDVDSTNSADDGVNLDGLANGIFQASAGDIGGAAGIGFDVNGGSGTILYQGNLNNGGGTTAVDITGRSGGAVNFSGPISDTSDAGGGINVTSNTGGSTTFGGTTKTLNTGTSDAVTMDSSDGHTLTFSNGGLDVDTTNGNGLAVTASGTLNVTGPGNTVNAGGGRALHVSDTNVGGAPLTFQQLASNGPSTGILLSNTGSNGALTVTGNGGTCTNADITGCTGGTIANGTGVDQSGATPTGTGIVLDNARGVSLTRMHVHDNSNYGIRGTTVEGLTLANSVFDNNGNSLTEALSEGNARFSDLLGTVNVTDSYFARGYRDNFTVADTASGRLDITLARTTVGAPGPLSATGDGVRMHATGNSALIARFTDHTSTYSPGDHIDASFGTKGRGSSIVTVDGVSRFSNSSTPSVDGGGLRFVSDGSPSSFQISNATLSGARGPAIRFRKTRATTDGMFVGVFNSTIGVSGQRTSGSSESSAILQEDLGNGSVRGNYNTNLISGYAKAGIEVAAGDPLDTPGGGTLAGTIANNVIGTPGTTGGPKYGLLYDIGTNPADTFTACASIKNNNIQASGFNPLGGPDIDALLRQRAFTTFQLLGWTAGGGAAGAATFVTDDNLVGGTPGVTATASGAGGGFGTTNSC
jgi:VCBS repeat-containing protein